MHSLSLAVLQVFCATAEEDVCTVTTRACHYVSNPAIAQESSCVIQLNVLLAIRMDVVVDSQNVGCSSTPAVPLCELDTTKERKM